MKRKVLFFTYSFPYGTGEQFIETEILFSSKSVDIHIVPLTNPNGIMRDVPNSVTIHQPIMNFSPKSPINLLFKGTFNLAPFFFIFKELFTRKVIFSLRNLKSWLNYSLTARIENRYIAKLTKRLDQKFDILYFYWGDNLSSVVNTFKSEHKTIIVRFHNSDLYEEFNNNYLPFRNRLLNTISHAIFISEDGFNYTLKKYAKTKCDKRVFRLGVIEHTSTQNSDDAIFIIASCSYLKKIKRVPLIAESLAILSQQIEWHHFGDGEDYQQLISITEKFPNNIKFIFHGQVSNQTVIDFYKENRVDLFINVSLIEGVPVSIMEAISFGIPVVATDVGGTREIVSNFNGCLLDKNLTNIELSNTISDIINSKSTQELRENSKRIFHDKCSAEKNYLLFSEFISKEIILPK